MQCCTLFIHMCDCGWKRRGSIVGRQEKEVGDYNEIDRERQTEEREMRVCLLMNMNA